MGWTNSHLYEIRAGDVGWSTPHPNADWSGDFLDARKARLDDVLEDIGTKKLVYIYDFGDGWEHTIKLERLADPGLGVALSTPDRGQRWLPSRGLRRSVGLCGANRHGQRP